MQKFLSALKRKLPTRLVPVLAVVAAIAAPVAIMAWGPSRATYTMENPAPHVTFNSITNNPEYGDERSFLTVRDLTTGQQLSGSTTVVPGHEYLFQVYVHNNAATNLNSAANGYRGIAQGTNLEAAIPSEVNGSAEAAAYIKASNATPGEVWDTVGLNSSGKVKLDYQEGTARLFTNHFTNGTQLSDNVMTPTGVKIGYSALDGKWPGCLPYSGTVTFRVKAHQNTSNFTVKKEVRKVGGTFAENVQIAPGEKVNYRLIVTNTGQTQLNNVLLKDTLPQGMKFVPGTVKIMNANNPNGAPVLNGDNLVSGGINIGSYTAGSNAIVIFDATAETNEKLPTCGMNTLKNVASAKPEGENPKEDDANVTVPKECRPPEAQVVCNGLAVKQISRTQFSFKGSKTVTNAEFVKYIYVVKNAKGETVRSIESTNDNAVAYENGTVGKYTVQVSVVAKVNGQEVTKTDAKCKGAFEVKEKPAQSSYKCDYLKLITLANRTDAIFEAKAVATGNAKVKEYRIDFGDNQSKVFSVGQETQAHTYAPGEYTAKLYVSFEADGKLVPNQTAQTCEAHITIAQPPVVPPSTPENPALPERLPATGPEAMLAGLVGSSAVGFGINAYVRSRRNLAAIRK